jgi:nitrate reductase cytochrome c-type subunit
MEGFQKIVLYAAIIILIIALVIIGISLSYSKNYDAWPPMVPVCPDYWTIDNTNKCVNTNNLGTCRAPRGSKHLTMNFSVAPYVGVNSSCAKYNWANNCKISWDAITYGVNNPCQTAAAK